MPKRLAGFTAAAAACLSLVGSGSASPTCSRVPLPAEPRAVAAAGDRIWVAYDRGVELFDLVMCQRVGTRIAMPRRARISPPLPKPGWVWGPDRAYRVVADGRRLWIGGELTLYRADAIRHVIDRRINVFRTDRVGTRIVRAPLDLFSFAPIRGSLWAANLSDDGTFLFQIDARSGKVERRLPADSEIVNMVAGAGWVWAVSHDEATLLRIDPRTGEFGRTRVSSDPHGIAFGAGYVWVALYHESTIRRGGRGLGCDERSERARPHRVLIRAQSDVRCGPSRSSLRTSTRTSTRSRR